MRCRFCSREIPEELVQAPCGRCLGGCRKVHCPFCGQENPATPAYLQRLAARSKNPVQEEDKNP